MKVHCDNKLTSFLSLFNVLRCYDNLRHWLVQPFHAWCFIHCIHFHCTYGDTLGSVSLLLLCCLCHGKDLFQVRSFTEVSIDIRQLLKWVTDYSAWIIYKIAICLHIHRFDLLLKMGYGTSTLKKAKRTWQLRKRLSRLPWLSLVSKHLSLLLEALFCNTFFLAMKTTLMRTSGDPAFNSWNSFLLGSALQRNVPGS